MHALSRQCRVLRAQGFEDFAMFFERLLEAAFKSQRVAPGQLDDLARIVDQLRQVAVAGNFLQGGVEALVGLEKTVGMVGGRVLLEFLVYCREARKVGAGGTASGDFRDPSFEQGHDGKHFVDVLFRQLGYVTTAAWLEHHEAFGSQYLERFAQRSAADAILLGERLLIYPAARRQLMGVNSRTQTLSHLFVEGGGDENFGRGSCIHNYGCSIIRPRQEVKRH